MKVKDVLDEEIDMATELIGEITQITLYKDKYKQLCDELGQPEIQIYRGMQVCVFDEESPKEEEV
jgi:hypothetical protein